MKIVLKIIIIAGITIYSLLAILISFIKHDNERK